MGKVWMSGGWGGNAATATKLETARKIQANLGSTSSASFDGSKDITPGVTGTLPIANGGTGATTAADALAKLGAAAEASHKLKTYTSLEQIGLTAGSETIDAICNALPSQSVLIIDVSSSNNGSIYPKVDSTGAAYGIMIVAKQTDARIIFEFFWQGTAAEYWYGSANTTGTWSGWKGHLSSEGGTITGQELWLYNGLSRWMVNSSGVQIEAMQTAKDGNNKTVLYIQNNKSALAEALKFFRYVNGTLNSYQLFGRHNKSSGSYSGNGSTTSRSISIGGTGTLLKVNGNGYTGIVSIDGAVFWNGTSVVCVQASALNFDSGTLTIASSDTKFNASGKTYYYEVL